MRKNVFERKKPFKHKAKLAYGLISSILVFAISLYLFPDFKEDLVSSIIKTGNEIKENIWAAVLGFVLVNGKFVMKTFIKKLIFLSAVKLSLRVVIEKIIGENVLNLFIKRIPLKAFLLHTKATFMEYSIVKRVTTAFVILAGAIGGLGFFGDLILFKTFIAQFWSYVLAKLLSLWALFLAILSTGWVAFIIELLILSWVMAILHRIPVIHRFLLFLLEKSKSAILKILKYFNKYLNNPAQRKILKATIKTSNWMHRTMGFEGYQTYREFVLKHRQEFPSMHIQLSLYRSIHKAYTSNLSSKRISSYLENKTSKNVSKREQILLNRRQNFGVSNKRLYLHKEHNVKNT